MLKNHISRRSRSFVRMWQGAWVLCCAMLMVACAEDGYDDDERFVSNVSGATLSSPAATDIIVTASADGKTQTISWPVVPGAGGYLVNYYDQGNPEEPIVKDSLVDGCSITVKREEDMNYVFSVRTLGKASAGNTEAQTGTELVISTFTPTYAVIPAGSDLNAWFDANPVPDDSIGVNLNYDLEGGASYTVSGVLDFDGHAVTLRSTSKTNHAHVTYTSGTSGITFSAPFNAKYIDFDCGALTGAKGVFAFSKNSTVEAAKTKDPSLYKWAGPLILNPITIVNCNFSNVKSYFFFDNQATTACMTFLVDNCVVHLAPETALGGGVFWTNKGGHINDLVVSNSTFYEELSCPGDYKYFYQAGLDKAPDLYADNTSAQAGATNSVTYESCTFYHVCWDNGQWGNYNGMQAKAYSYWNMLDCIFYDCSTSGSVPRRFLHGRGNQPTATFRNNTYMKDDGTFQDPQNYDTSGTNIEEDPMFANPAAADFHISGPTQVARKTGDPRWLP